MGGNSQKSWRGEMKKNKNNKKTKKITTFKIPRIVAMST